MVDKRVTVDMWNGTKGGRTIMSIIIINIKVTFCADMLPLTPQIMSAQYAMLYNY